MDQADFSSFLKTIIIILFIYYFIKFTMRLLAPYLMKKAVEKVQENFQKKAGDYFNQAQGNSYDSYESKSKQESHSGNINLKEKKKVGEYIDYEELD